MLEELDRLLRLAGCETVTARGSMPMEAAAGPKPVVYLVDDADRVDRDDVAALLARPRCTVLLAGLPALGARCGAVPLVTLGVLTRDEGAAFVRQYLEQAGQDPALLTEAAVARVAALSGGVLRELCGLVAGALWLAGPSPVSDRQIDDVAAFRRSFAEEPDLADAPKAGISDPGLPLPGLAEADDPPAALAEVVMRRHAGAMAVPDGHSAPAPVAEAASAPVAAHADGAAPAATGPAPRGRSRAVLAGALAATVLGAAGGYTALQFGLLDGVVRRSTPPVLLAEAAPQAAGPVAAPAVDAAPEPEAEPSVEALPSLAAPMPEGEPPPAATLPPEPSLDDAVPPLQDPPAVTAADLAPAVTVAEPVMPFSPAPAEAVAGAAALAVPEPPPEAPPAPIVAAPDPVVAALPEPPLPPVAGPPPIPRAKPARPRLPAETLRLLLDRGAKLTASGDLSGARLLYMRAADGGSAAAALALGRLYDPSVLMEMGASLAGDPARAADWYRRAIELDDSEAAALLRRLEARTR